MLTKGSELWKIQAWLERQVVIGSFIWLVADPKLRQFWAKRILASYVDLYDETVIDWSLSGVRHAFLIQPDSPARTQALKLFTLIEQKKSAETVKKLTTLLGLPPPKSGSAR